MTAWLKSLRLPVCLLSSLLTIASFRLGKVNIPWLVVTAVFFIACSTMLQNDWRDRRHDSRKGKMLALQYPQLFLGLLLVFWITTGCLIFAAAIESSGIEVILVVMALAGLIYSEIRRIPIASIVLVALTSGSPALLSIMTGASRNQMGLLFLSTALVIFGREITKDLDDERIDSGYKWTIPLAIGSKWAKIVAIVAILAGLAVATQISPMVLPSMLFATVGVIMLACNFQPKITRTWLDVGIAIIIVTIIFLN